MYLDPGSWGLVLQFLVGVIIAIPVLIGIYWKKVKLMFKRGKGGESK